MVSAAKLRRAQDAIIQMRPYTQKLQELLGVRAIERAGRRSRLTPTGAVLYRRARALLDEAGGLESAASTLSAGWEPEIRIAVDIIFPTWLLLQAFSRFGAEQPLTRIELYETVLGGTQEALRERTADIVIGSQIPSGFAGDPLMHVRFVAVAHPDHALHQLGRELTLQDLRKYRHLLIRDTGSDRKPDSPLGAAQVWTVSNKATSIHAVCLGLGFAWFAEEAIRSELDSGRLKPLPLREGLERWVDLYLAFADRDYAGPGTLRLAQIIRELTGGCGRKPA